MIASPSDVAKERQLVRDVIHEWNAVNAGDRKTVLMPIGWETHSAPETGDRPQAIINKQLLRSCDLLVAVFWARLGSPTGVASSGTVEEVEEHLSRGKPAMIYFSSAPVRLDSVDEEQYRKLREFKENVRSRSLFAEYEDLASFRTDFARHLAQTIISTFTPGEASEPDAPPAPRPGLPPLSQEARELLAEAALDAGGAIMRLSTLGGEYVQTNGRDFVESGSRRSEALWRGAVDELRSLGLVEDRAGTGQVFFITDSGYRTSDLLKAT
jgi:hypothetical protein